MCSKRFTWVPRQAIPNQSLPSEPTEEQHSSILTRSFTAYSRVIQKPRGSVQGVPNAVTGSSSQQDLGFLPVTIRTGLCRCANLSTKRGRRNHALMIMLVSVIPVIALLIQNSIDVYGHGQELSLHKTVKREILFRWVERREEESRGGRVRFFIIREDWEIGERKE
ncbi:hypothetical protein ElyMa_000193500 [Elysia marginata]|uniref:Uncharacterized protein n=1 Tax=Elysia marginata TaxID=1093978 RepID=A0AAV4EUZ1_9GAST|nr:hypothetical protein ElyMa_000193500 [Elysia marginata]